MAYNRFGAVFSDVVALYPGSVADDFGGQATIEAAIDTAVDVVAGAITGQTYQAITEPQLLMVVRGATAGQTTFTLPILPVVAGTVHLWTGVPRLFQVKPRLLNDPMPPSGGTLTYSAGYGVAGPQVELDRAAYTVNTTSGLVTLNMGLDLDMVVYASYQVDTNAAAYAVPSLARCAVRGAAEELGARIYSDGQQEWGLVGAYGKQFSDRIAAMRSGVYIPDEVRLLRWWNEIERAGSAGGSVRFQRG
jgi:hypothetical protein